VDVIDTNLYEVVNSIPIPARNPRGIAFSGAKVYVVAFLSGNGSAPMGTVGRFRTPSTGSVCPGPLLERPSRPGPVRHPTGRESDRRRPRSRGTVTGLGTTLFNIHARPGTSELWIPNTDALNAVHKGEVNFVAGQVISNRITIVDASGAAPPRVIDLDAIAPSDRKCAQPAYVEFDPSGTRAYVCGYGSDLVAVLDLGTGGP
jgi:DNA-binding beta-propeller fold protein YncE